MSADLQTAMPQTLELGKIHQGDCIERMRQIESGTIDLVFADPPFNIGYEYDEYHDRQDDHEYEAWSAKWIGEVHRILKPNGTFWLAIGDEYAAELKMIAKETKFATRSWVIWYYTFGVNCTKKFSRSHVHLFHFVKNENDFKFNSDDIRVPSARALVYGDKRANPAGRLPDDTWILRPQDLPEGFQATDDTWYYARVAGTFKERQGFHGCQMPEQLLGRIIRVSSNPGDRVLDPFAGSGTTLAAAKKLGRKWIGCELSEEYVRAATDRLDSVVAGASLDGPADPIASAPSTANGRKLESKEVEAAVSAVVETDANDQVRTQLGSVKSSNTVDVKASNRSSQQPVEKRKLREIIRDAIVDAFYTVHEGNSIDWLLANPRIQEHFHDECQLAGLIGSPAEWNRALLRLRKTGEFPKRVAIKRVTVTTEEMDEYCFAAEMAWKLVSEKLGGVSLDEILCDPEKARQFDDTARRFGGSFQPHEFRWAALHLRKASKELVQDAKKYRHSALKGRDFGGRYDWKSVDFDRYLGQTGVYLLRNKGGDSLYVGDSIDLGVRLKRHAGSGRALQIGSMSIVPLNHLPADDYHAPLRVERARQYETRLNVDLFAIHNVGI